MTRKSEKMLQSLLVEVCAKEAKAVVRAAVRWSDNTVICTRPCEMSLARAISRYERAKKRRPK